jgi:hypothetical protein
MGTRFCNVLFRLESAHYAHVVQEDLKWLYEIQGKDYFKIIDTQQARLINNYKNEKDKRGMDM